MLLEENDNSGAESESVAVSGADSAEDSAAPNSPIASGEIYEIEMRNQGTDGVMVFEPSVVSLQVGDSVTFKATDAGHNSASIEGMIPEGADIWDSGMSQDITITFTEEGTYVYQCTPHLMMAMVGVITVGDSNKNLKEIVAAAAEKKSLVAFFFLQRVLLSSCHVELRKNKDIVRLTNAIFSLFGM